MLHTLCMTFWHAELLFTKLPILLIPVKNCEGSETLLYIWPKLSFMSADIRHKIPASETKNHYSWQSEKKKKKVSIFAWFLSPDFTGWYRERPWHLHMQQGCSKELKENLLELQSKPVKTLPLRETLLQWRVNKSAFCSRERHYKYLLKIECPLYKHPWKGNLKSKADSVSAHVRNRKDPWRISKQPPGISLYWLRVYSKFILRHRLSFSSGVNSKFSEKQRGKNRRKCCKFT